MKKKIFLVGIPSCGKSTLGEQSAVQLQLPFYDTDEMAKANVGEIRPTDIFSIRFMSLFHEEQQKAVTELCEMENAAIVGTGAEIGLIPSCVEQMRDVGIIIHVKRDLGLVLEGLKESAINRTVLVEVDTGIKFDLHEKAAELYAEELSKYDAVADITLKNDGSEEEGVKKLIQIIQTILD